MTRDIPILMSAPMVRATLAGDKTETRRKLKPQPREWKAGILDIGEPIRLDDGHWGQVETVWSGPLIPGMCEPDHEVWHPLKLRWTPGDRLYIRETFGAFGRWETRPNEEKGRDEWYFVDLTTAFGFSYRFDLEDIDGKRKAGQPTWHIRPSLFMPRAASRITLEVTEVRVERLQDIDSAGAAAEGIEYRYDCWGTWDADGHQICGGSQDPIEAYRCLWININGTGSWEANPWVAVIKFKRVIADAPGGQNG